MKITYTEYERLAKFLAHYLDLMKFQNKKITEKDLIEHYLDTKEKANVLETTEILEQETAKIKHVIDRLINKDRILIVAFDADNEADRVLMKHENFHVTETKLNKKKLQQEEESMGRE